jgi:hypothetical protein
MLVFLHVYVLCGFVYHKSKLRSLKRIFHRSDSIHHSQNLDFFGVGTGEEGRKRRIKRRSSGEQGDNDAEKETGWDNSKILVSSDAKFLFHYMNTKRKLLKVNAAVYFNEACRNKSLISKYVRIKVVVS